MMTRGTEDSTHGVWIDRMGYERFGNDILRIFGFTLIEDRLLWAGGIF